MTHSGPRSDDKNAALIERLFLELLAERPKGWSVVRGTDEIIIRTAQRTLGKVSVAPTYGGDHSVSGFYVSFFSRDRNYWVESTRVPAQSGVAAGIFEWADGVAQRAHPEWTGRKNESNQLLSLPEYRILNSCADDYECFYVPFSYMNYGGFADPFSARMPVTVPSEVVVTALRKLISVRFLTCWREAEDDPSELIRLAEPELEEFDIYRGYDCWTFDEHIDRFGSGPHVFVATELGIEEVDRAEYREYDQTLGWH